MKIKILIICISLSLLITSGYAQKVKYKDIFALLTTKQYEQAEPFLKKYLKENNDNPNAFLYMGITFQEKALKNDILKQTKVSIANMDSAILFLDKAYKSLDEREVRKNKEYYQAYNRRDLRTGEFGVKLSDIQFDIEKKIEGLKERIDRVKMVRYYFALADSFYRKSHATYVALQKTYASERQLYLRSGDATVKNLNTLIARYDSAMKAFENYKTSTSMLGKTGYNQTLAPREISDFTKDGAEPANFYAEEVNVWDYKKFAEKARSTLEKEIFPMREHLITYDKEINKLRERLNNDSVSVRSDLTKLIDKLLYEQLRKFDPEPLPMEVFSLKTSDLEYRSLLLEHKSFRDSADLHFQIRTVTTEMKLLSKLDSIALKLSSENIDEKAADYKHFVENTYANLAVLKSYISTLKDYALRERKKKEDVIANLTRALNYIVDGNDSIPLSADMMAAKRFNPLFTTEEKFTLGLAFRDTANTQAYFYTITPSRKPDVKVVFPVDKKSFNVPALPTTKALTYSDGTGQVYYVLIYSDKAVNDKYPAMLAKIYRSDGLAWSIDYPLTFIPKEINFKVDNGELTIKDESHLAVIDKNGKPLK